MAVRSPRRSVVIDTHAVVVGIDEAGRGALAGPVVAAACVFDLGRKRCPVLIADSKQMTPEQREESFAWITAHCPHGVGMIDAQTIDAVGILAATERAMQMAVDELGKTVRPTYLLVDGRDAFWFDYPHSSVIRGDQTEACISAASILAKVTRDRMMCAYDAQFPFYGFAQHKGYGTEEHQQAIMTHNCCSLHRRSFISEAPSL